MPRRLAALVCCAGCLACAPPLDPQPPIVPAPPGATSGADESTRTDGESLLPPPPSGTLRAPADDRREEVDPVSGLPPAQAQ